MTTNPIQQETEENSFGPVIFSYTRQQAIDDAVLIDQPLTHHAKILGVHWHTAMTSGLFFRASGDAQKENILSVACILAFKESIRERLRQNKGEVSQGDRWPVTIGKQNGVPDFFQNLTFHVVFSVEPPFGPCWTFMLPHED